MTTLAWELTFYAQRSVQNRTGLTGNYDFTLEFCRDQLASGSSAVAPDGQAVPSASDPCGAPPFLTAVQQQLGLKMEAGKGPVQVIVISIMWRGLREINGGSGALRASASLGPARQHSQSSVFPSDTSPFQILAKSDFILRPPVVE